MIYLNLIRKTEPEADPKYKPNSNYQKYKHKYYPKKTIGGSGNDNKWSSGIIPYPGSSEEKGNLRSSGILPYSVFSEGSGND
ncbi:unnamed protein product [Rhizophagus irregularis]|nr:unnamed protein product [Rhizophagus irregularis]